MSIRDYSEQLLQQATNIARRVARQESTRLRWATVESVDPLRIRYDGEDSASVVSPQTLVVCREGQRVQVARYRGQATVLGAAEADDTGWYTITTKAAYPWAGHGSEPSMRRIGDMMLMRGRFERNPSKDFGTSSTGYGLYSLDAAHSPSYTVRFPITSTGGPTAPYGTVEISAAGEIRAWLTGNSSWIETECWWGLT